jgi:hypothetical protein
MANLVALGKREIGLFKLFVMGPFLARDFLRVGGRSGHGVAIAKPPREIAVLAPLRAERCVILDTGLFADRAGFGHDVMIWA